MYLIDYVDFIFSLCWREFGMFDDFSYVFDTGIARSIYLYHIYHSLIGKSEAVLTFFTRVSVGEDIGTIHSLCKDSSQGRLACSVESEEYIAMVDCLVFA